MTAWRRVRLPSLVIACGTATQPAKRGPEKRVVADRTPTHAEAADNNPLALPADAAQQKNAKLRGKLAASPHNYFRAVNLRFAREVCRRFERVIITLPLVNLHGDPHVEQFAVTEHSVGLSDFDDSVSGPAVLDLVRFGTSVVLTAKAHGWDGPQLRELFLSSYQQALRSLPGREAEPAALPSIVKRIRQGFSKSRSAFLNWAESRMVPPKEPRKSEAEQGYARYVQLMLRLDEERDEAFFALKRWGILEGQGIGSASAMRLLARIEGPSPAPEDDVILEAKEIGDMSSVPCVDARRGNALRVVAASVRFQTQADPFLAIIPRGADEALDDPPWWIQSWSSNYAELDLQRSLQSQSELAKVVTFVGNQMARGHTNLLPPPFDAQLAALVTQMLAEHGPAIIAAIDSLAELTLMAHAAMKTQQAT